MRKFIIEIAVFVVITSVLLGAVLYVVNNLLVVDGFYDMNDDYEVLILGDSHAECGIDDSNMPYVRNYAQSGETYFYTYQKLKAWLPNNDHIKTVFVEFNVGQILTSVNPSTWDDEHLSAKVPKYCTAMNFADHMLLLVNNPLGYTNALSLTINQNWELLEDSADHFNALSWGTYTPLHHDGSNELVVDDNFRIGLEEVQSVSETNLYYLDQIVALCRENDVRCVFIRCPIHVKYSGLRYEATFQYVLHDRYADIEFIDFVGEVIPETGYADAHHLNQRGAEAFTTIFRKEVLDY